MITAGSDVQEPTVGIFEDVDIFVRNLPQQIVEVFPGFWRWYFLVDRIATD